MSRRNAKLAKIHDLQCHISDYTLTKRDLEFILKGLRMLDNYEFSGRDKIEHEALTLYFSHLVYGKRN